MKKQTCRLLVVGNSRSGTTYVGRMLKEIGLDIGHEYVRKDGTVSCYFFIDTPRYPLSPSTPPKGLIAHVGQRKKHYRFKRTVHLVRDPLKTIGSMWSTMGTEHQKWLEKYGIIPKDIKPKLLKMMHAWYEVNRRCEQISSKTFRMEDVTTRRKHWHEFLAALDLDAVAIPEVPPSSRNTSRGIFKAKTVTWEMLLDLDHHLAYSIMEMAARYGYRVPKKRRSI